MVCNVAKDVANVAVLNIIVVAVVDYLCLFAYCHIIKAIVLLTRRSNSTC